ncbi:hypothetical protein TcCL_Unassigned02524 [Trypanosoma cruzi]|nr:hypothetical protein TcCL_Unassigned02524 [Trypanosoma cruzi]
MCEIAGPSRRLSWGAGGQSRVPALREARRPPAAAAFSYWARSVSARFFASLPAAFPLFFVMRGSLCRLRRFKSVALLRPHAFAPGLSRFRGRDRFPKMLTGLVAALGGQGVRSNLPRRCCIEQGFLFVAQRFVFIV